MAPGKISMLTCFGLKGKIHAFDTYKRKSVCCSEVAKELYATYEKYCQIVSIWA